MVGQIGLVTIESPFDINFGGATVLGVERAIGLRGAAGVELWSRVQLLLELDLRFSTFGPSEREDLSVVAASKTGSSLHLTVGTAARYGFLPSTEGAFVPFTELRLAYSRTSLVGPYESEIRVQNGVLLGGLVGVDWRASQHVGVGASLGLTYQYAKDGGDSFGESSDYHSVAVTWALFISFRG